MNKLLAFVDPVLQDGTFELAVPAGQQWFFYFSADSNGKPGIPRRVSGGVSLGKVDADTTVDVTLPVTHRVTVTVLDESGAPVSGARVQLTKSPSNNYACATPLTVFAGGNCNLDTYYQDVVTDSQGVAQFWVGDTGSGSLTLTTSRSGAVLDTRSITVTSNINAKIELK